MLPRLNLPGLPPQDRRWLTWLQPWPGRWRSSQVGLPPGRDEAVRWRLAAGDPHSPLPFHSVSHRPGAERPLGWLRSEQRGQGRGGADAAAEAGPGVGVSARARGAGKGGDRPRDGWLPLIPQPAREQAASSAPSWPSWQCAPHPALTWLELLPPRPLRRGSWRGEDPAASPEQEGCDQ